MTTLTHICGLPLVHALGWTLLHLCWQGAGVAAVLWCVLEALGGRASRARYAASCLALGLMIALPLATFAHLASDEYRLRAALDGPMAIDPGMTLVVGAGEMAANWPVRIAVALDRALPWILVAWFAGVIFFVGRLNVGLMVARRMRSMGTGAVPAELQQAFDALRRRLGVERAVRLMHSALVEAPTVIGWLRPVVLVPASCLTGLSTMQIEAVLAHELAHIRRHDYLVSVLQSVIETLLFYHPAVWWVSKQIRRERECCCDELAVAVSGDRLAYARALSLLEERRSFNPEFALGANGGVLKMRIKRLLGCKEDGAVSQFAAFTVLALAVALAGSYELTVARAEAGAVSHAARVASPMELEPAVPLNTLIAAPAVRQFQLKETVLMVQAEAPAATPTTDAPAVQGGPVSILAGVAPAPGGPVRLSSGVVAGMILTKVDPVYPPEAKEKHVQGAVILHAIISKQGTMENLSVISGNGMLVASAMDAVRQWTYRPYLLNGQPVEVETSITVNYTMADSVVVGQSPAVNNMPNFGDPNSPLGNSMGRGSGTGIGSENGLGPGSGGGYDTGVRQIGGGVTKPIAIYIPEAKYTEEAKKAKFMGVVLVSIIVDKFGKPQNVHVTKGVGHGLDEKAAEAVKQYRFKPATENGKPVAVYMNVEVNFEIF
jgi:TonB family protein